MVKTSPPLSLEEFLKQPERKPACEYIDGKLYPKPTPKRQHSLLQSELCMAINAASQLNKVAYAFPELRCTYGGCSLIPDLAILYWDKIELDADGIPVDDVYVAPDWIIEILSPDQSANRVTANIVHCLKYGCQLGWLVDPRDQSIMVFEPDQLPTQFQGEEDLIIPNQITLTLCTKDIFDWLKLR